MLSTLLETVWIRLLFHTLFFELVESIGAWRAKREIVYSKL